MSARSTAERTGINIASQWFAHIAVVAVNFFLIAYVVGKVGPKHYGGWTTIISIIGYLYILSAGMSVTVQHYVARLSAREEHDKLVSIFSSSYIIYGMSAVVGLSVCVWVSFFYPSLFPKVPFQARQECSIALRWVALSIFLFMLNLPIQGALFGLQRHYIRNLIEVLGQLLRAAAVVVFFNIFKPSLVYLGVAYFAGTCVRFFLCRIALWRIKPELRFRPSMINKEALREMFSYGGHSFIWTICTVIIRDSAPILAVLLISPEAATFWYIGNRIAVAIGELVKGAGQIFVPVVSSLYGSEKWEELKAVLIRSTRFCALFGFNGAAASIIFGQDLIEFWVGPGYSVSYYVLVISVLGWIASWIFSAAEAMLMGVRKLQMLTSMLLFRLIAGMLLAIIMAKTWGILGLAAGLAIPTAITSGLFIPYFSSEFCKLKLKKLMMAALPTPLGISLIVSLCILSMQAIWPVRNIGIFVTQCGMALIIFGILALLFGLDPASRNILLNQIWYKTNQF